MFDTIFFSNNIIFFDDWDGSLITSPICSSYFSLLCSFRAWLRCKQDLDLVWHSLFWVFRTSKNKLIFYISVRFSTINGIDFFSLGPILQESRPSSLFAFFFIRIRFCVGIPLVFLSQFKTCVFKTNKKSSLWFYFETAKKIPRGRVPTSTNTIYKIKTPFIDHSFWFM